MPFPAPTGYAPPELLNGGYSAPSGGVVTPEIASQIQQMNEQAAMYGQPGLPEPQVGSPLMPYVLDLAAQDMSFAQNIAQAGGIPWDQVQPHIDQAQRQIREDVAGGVIGRTINSAVRPVGEYFAEHPAALFALPFAVGGAMGAFGAAGAGGGAAAAGGSGGAATTFPLASGGAITGSAIPGVTSGATAAGAAAAGIAPAVAGVGSNVSGAANAVASGLNWSTIVPSIVSGVTGVLGANEQADASREALALSERMFDTARGDALPRIQTGNRAVGVLDDYLGLTTGTPNRARFTESPSYQYNLEQTQKAGERALGSMGLRQSGAMVREAQRNASGLASREDSKFIDTLLAAAGLGTTGAAASAAAGANNASIGGNAIQNRGAARSSGYSSINDAVQGGYANNFLQQYLKRNPVYA